MTAAWNDEQIQNSLQEALAQPEYENLRREAAASKVELGWLERLLERIFGDGSSDPRSPDGSNFDLPDLSTVVVVLVVLLVLFALAAWLRTRDGSRTTPTLPKGPKSTPILGDQRPGDLLLTEWIERARNLAAKGQHAAGIRCLLLGGMSWTEERGFVRPRPGLSNHSYLRALSTQPEQSAAFGKIVESFERVYFGHHEANNELFTRCLDALTRGFRHGQET